MRSFLIQCVRVHKAPLGLILILLTSLWAGRAEALNGLQLIGVGAVHRALGGAGVAQPLDSTAVYLNPAGLGGVGRRFDFSFSFGFPNNHMTSSTAAAGNPVATNVDSQDGIPLLPSVSLSYPFGDRFVLGLGTFATAGFNVDYPASRLGLAADAYDTGGRYGLLKIIPGFSYKVLDNLYIGAGLNINYATLQSDGATAALTETTGRNRQDAALGIGGTVGVVYQPLDWLSTGLTYTTPQYFETFDRYRDLFSQSLDMPMQIAVGVGVKPLLGGLILADFRWINWSGVAMFGHSPGHATAPGMGWQDQYVLETGLQYDFDARFDFPVILRAGYNYGRSTITPPVVFANLLVPAFNKHHITAGGACRITKNVAVSVAYAFMLENTLTDDGTLSPLGQNATMSTSGQAVSTQLEVTF